MAETTTTYTSLTDAPVDAENSVKKIKVSGVDYAINDATARTSVTNINSCIGEIQTDISAINTETSGNTSSISTIKTKLSNAYEASYDTANFCLELTPIGEIS